MRMVRLVLGVVFYVLALLFGAGLAGSMSQHPEDLLLFMLICGAVAMVLNRPRMVRWRRALEVLPGVVMWLLAGLTVLLLGAAMGQGLSGFAAAQFLGYQGSLDVFMRDGHTAAAARLLGAGLAAGVGFSVVFLLRDIRAAVRGRE